MKDELETVFNLYEQTTPINKNLEIVITPSPQIKKYEYIIKKDNQEILQKEITTILPETIIFDKTGKYQIEVITYDWNNKATVYTSGNYVIDKERPCLILDKRKIALPLNSHLKFMEGVTAYDKQDGNLLKEVITNYEQLDFSKPGLQYLTYTVTDQAGNKAIARMEINIYQPKVDKVLGIQSFLSGLLIIIILFLIRYRRSLKREKRIVKYSINPLSDDSLSLGDRLVSYYQKVIDKISFGLNKSVLITNFSNRYDKYINVINNTYFTGLNYVSEKVLMALMFVVMALFSKLIRYEFINIYETLIPLLFGFFLPDVVYIFKYRRYRNQLENDFLQAIIVMNNAFKSGASITQAIELVTKELEGPMAQEFNKMAREIKFGLSIDVVFKRFADRVVLEEARYLTAALTILSKTGGNIIKVFSSIEKTLFNKKTLKLELKSLTGSSKIIVTILVILPLFFIFVITLINPSYFGPLYTTSLGKALILLMVIIYSAYLYVIQKFIRVRL